MGSQNLTPEERERRRQAAKAMHNQVVIDPVTGEERRKFGGAQPGSGRPKADRAAQRIADAARGEMSGSILQAFKDGLSKDAPISVRVQTAKTVLEIENKEAQLQLKEREELRKLDNDEIAGRLLGLLQKVASSGILDGEFEEIDDQRQIGASA